MLLEIDMVVMVFVLNFRIVEVMFLFLKLCFDGVVCV